MLARSWDGDTRIEDGDPHLALDAHLLALCEASSEHVVYRGETRADLHEGRIPIVDLAELSPHHPALEKRRHSHR